MNEKLSETRCTPTGSHHRPLTETEIGEMMAQVPDWALMEEDGKKQLRRTFGFRDFVTALGFANRVGEIAETEGHHPAITLTWGRATVSWYTHMIGGLHKNDFIMAAKTDQLRA